MAHNRGGYSKERFGLLASFQLAQSHGEREPTCRATHAPYENSRTLSGSVPYYKQIVVEVNFCKIQFYCMKS